MTLQEITKESLPLIMQLVGDDVLQEGGSAEEAFAAAHAALAALQAARLQSKLEVWPARSMANLTKDLPGAQFLSDLSIVAFVVLGSVCFLGSGLIPCYSSFSIAFLSLVWPTGILTQGGYARLADRWLGQSDERASYLERFFLMIPGKACFEHHYLVQHEALVDLVSAAIDGDAVDLVALNANSTHLPHPLCEQISRAVATRDVGELSRIRDRVLRPSDVAAVATRALFQLKAAFDKASIHSASHQRDFGLLDYSTEIEQGAEYYSAL